MPGPARAGALIYAKDLEHLSSFYQQVMLMDKIHGNTDNEDAEYHVLESPDIQLVIHAIPAQLAATITLTSPPEPRENTPLKLFFTVPSLSGAASTAQRLGGQLLEPEWLGSGFRVRNGYDPEGNIFQLRESMSISSK